MKINAVWKLARAVERIVRLFVKACPLCNKGPRIEFCYRIPDSIFPFDENALRIRLRNKRWRLRIACWNNDLPRDEICMLKTGPATETFWDAIHLSLRVWNDIRRREIIREQLLGKTLKERAPLPWRIVPGIHNGAANVAWLTEEIRDWIKDIA